MWIKRKMEDTLLEQKSGLELFPIWLLLGPRQVGKTSLFKHCADSHRQFISLDDWAMRTAATEDPALFLSQLKIPFLIDEIQYAPQLLSGLKLLVDSQSLPAGSIWLTGSQNFTVMSGVRESLAGRVALLNLFGLSDDEKQSDHDVVSCFDSILETSFPKLKGVADEQARASYLNSYVQTYIEKDVMELAGVSKRREFELFVKLCALRTAQEVEYNSLAKDAGVSPVTAKEWLSVLESSFLIKLVLPYYSNRSKRLIKNPKLHFCDAGLAAYLGGWRGAESLRLSPMAGHFFETHIFSQILKYFSARNQECQFHFWRTKDGQEIDLLIETKGKIFPVEIKIGSVSAGDLVPLAKIREKNWMKGHVVSPVASLLSPHLDWKSALPNELFGEEFWS